MSRYTGPKAGLFAPPRHEPLRAPRASRRPRAPPLPPGRARPHPPPWQRVSEYLIQLQEKQKARFTYGLSERQFRNLYEEANRRPGVTGENMLRFLELRSTTSCTAPAGRPLAPGPPVRRPRPHQRQRPPGQHPGYRVRKGDIVALAPKARNMIIDPAQPRRARPHVSSAWLETGDGGKQVTVRELPLREHIDVPVREQLIVELYCK